MSSKPAKASKAAVVVYEEHAYTREQVEECFQCDGDELKRILQHLRALKYLKINKTADIQNDMTPLADEAVDITESLANVTGFSYTFTFVGVLVVGDLVLQSYPKYFNKKGDAAEQRQKFKTVLKVLKKFNKQSKTTRIYTDGKKTANFNFLELMLYLMEDYNENGLYNNSQTVIELNGEGDILWDMTVNQTYPIFSNKRPIYTDLYTTKVEDDLEDFIRRLHSCILTTCTRFFKENRLYDLFEGLPEIDLSEETLDEFGDEHYLLYRLERELAQQFNTHKQQLLHALHAFISHRTDMDRSDYTMLYGTTTFNLIWEKACAAVFQNRLDDRLGDLAQFIHGGLQGKYQALKDVTLKELIEKPTWGGYDKDDKCVYEKEALATLIPDIINIYYYVGETYFSILDAKYYVMTFNPLGGQPGIGDITKQYLYNLAYKDFIDTHKISRVCNCFLMPEDEVGYAKRGYARLDILNFLHVKNIDVILLSADSIFEYYLYDKKWGEEFNKVLNLVHSEHYGSVIAV